MLTYKRIVAALVTLLFIGHLAYLTQETSSSKERAFYEQLKKINDPSQLSSSSSSNSSFPLLESPSQTCTTAFILSSDAYFTCTAVAIFSYLQTRPASGTVLFVTENVDPQLAQVLAEAFPSVLVHHIGVILNPNPKQKVRADRVLFNFTKWRIWQLDSKTVIYMDSDFLVLRSLDSLCSLSSSISAVHNFDSKLMEYTDDFNAGFLVIKPSPETLDKMLDFSSTFFSEKGGDQAAINAYYKGKISELPTDIAPNANAWKRKDSSWRSDSIHTFHMTREFNPCVGSFTYFEDNLSLYRKNHLPHDHPHFLWIKSFDLLQREHPLLIPFIDKTFRQKPE